MKEAMKRVTVTLRPDVVDFVQSYADKRSIAFSAAIRCIIHEYLELVPSSGSEVGRSDTVR